jgi:hypothetical protein
MTNINRKQFQAFPFHLVDPSPWPLLTSFALLVMTIGAVMYFHGFTNGGYLLSLGFILTSSAMILWFRDVAIEGTKKTNYKKIKLIVLMSLRLFKFLLNFNLTSLVVKLASKLIIYYNLFYSDYLIIKNNIIIRYKLKESLLLKNTLVSEPYYLENNLNTFGFKDKNSESEIEKIYTNEELGHYLAGLLEGDGNINIPASGNTTLNRVLNPRITFTGSKSNLILYKTLQNLLGGIGRFSIKDDNT